MRFRSSAPNLSARSLFRTPYPVDLFMCFDAFSLQFGLVPIRCKFGICPAFWLVPLLISLYAVDYSKKPFFRLRSIKGFACLYLVCTVRNLYKRLLILFYRFFLFLSIVFLYVFENFFKCLAFVHFSSLEKCSVLVCF